MTYHLTPAQQAQLLTPAAQRLMQALREAGGEARIVGGAVRDVVMGRPIGDIDLATTLPPERVMEILAAQQIKTVPTGLAHGTVTAVVDHAGYEITTLRRDVATDGRHAQIEYTDDWRADAARRDFTINALYVDAAGMLYDYFDGLGDAAVGRVRFIGDAHARIREDVLRILRFFRFHAWFGAGEPDAPGLAACHQLADLIPNLSAERIARETLKLLAAPNPLPVWTCMLAQGVAQHIALAARLVSQLQTLLNNEAEYKEPPAALTRLAALLPPDDTVAAAVAAQLKLSKRDGETLAALAKLTAQFAHPFAPLPLRHALYLYGAANTRAALFITGKNIADSLRIIDAWENPTFPLRGEDLLALGIPPGPRIGALLKAAEQWWIAGDFRASRSACMGQINQQWDKS